LVDRGTADDSTRLAADRDRLRTEGDRLIGSIAAGVPADTVAPASKERQAEIAKLEVRLRTPRQAPPNIERLRAALEQRAAQWKADQGAEPKVVRLLLRRLIGPLTLWEEPRPEWCRWEAPAKAAGLLDGLADRTYLVASPSGNDGACVAIYRWFAITRRRACLASLQHAPRGTLTLAAQVPRRSAR